ncbi:hypothetical protein F5Y12DRAFT_722822 [Xylaria sp. FL1777]|nr:hypothetical protein F5Y12DRAFT_722822 [Xylaria sp. FL1777]
MYRGIYYSAIFPEGVTNVTHAPTFIYNGLKLGSIISSIPLLSYFRAYWHVPFSVWLQLAHAYGVRLFLLWSLMSLLLLVLRLIPGSAVFFIVELYITSFWPSLILFSLINFPKFTIIFIGLSTVFGTILLITLAKLIAREVRESQANQ